MAKTNKLSDPFLESKQYSGKVYSISSRSGDIDLSSLRQELNGRKKYLNISDEVQEDENLIIPDVFKDDEGTLSTVLTITDVEIVEKADVRSLVGRIVLDEEKLYRSEVRRY